MIENVASTILVSGRIFYVVSITAGLQRLALLPFCFGNMLATPYLALRRISVRKNCNTHLWKVKIPRHCSKG